MPAWAPPEADEQQSWQPPEADSWTPPEAVEPPTPPKPDLGSKGLFGFGGKMEAGPTEEQIAAVKARMDAESPTAIRPSIAEKFAKTADAIIQPITGGRAAKLTDILFGSTREATHEDQIIPEIPPAESTAGKIGAGVGNVPIRFANFALSPEGAALGQGIGVLPKALRTLMGALFSAEEAKAAIQSDTLQEQISHGLGALAIGTGTVADARSKPTLTEALFPEKKAPAPEIPPAPAEVAATAGEISKEVDAAVPAQPAVEEVKPNAEQITQAAQPDGVRAEPAVPPKAEEPAAPQSGEGIPESRQGAQVQEVAPPTAGEPIEQAPKAEVLAPETPASPAAAEGQPGAVPAEAAQATPETPVSPLRRFVEDAGLGLKNAPFAEGLGARSAIDTWKDRARSLMDVGSSIKRFVENAPQRDEVAAKFDAANNEAGYVARQARNHVEIAGRDIALPNSELAQKAATFVRQANGDKAGMIAKLNAIKGKGYDDVIAYAQKHWDALEKISDAAKSGTDAAFEEAKAAGTQVDYRDNYVKGAYHDPVTQKVIFDETGGGRGTATSFKKAKVFNDYAEAISAGFKPRELRLDILTESAVNAMLKAVNRKAWADSIGEIKMPDDSPAVAPATENGSAPRGYRPVQVTPGNLVNIHEDLAPTIEGLTANSTIPRLLAQGGAFIKHNILVFDIFHGSRFAQMQAAFEMKIPSYRKGLALLEYSDKDLAAAQKHGLISADEAKFAQENRPKIEALIQNGLNAGRISDAIYADAVPLMPGAKATNRFIFEKLSRGVITQSAIYALDRNAALHPEWTPKELNRYTAKEINTYYRNLGNQGVFKSKTFQDLARGLIFAPQWIEGLVRSEARGYGQLGKVATTGSLGNIGKGMATGLVAYFAFSQLVNLLTRGKPTWENPEPGHKLDAWIPDVIQGSNGFFVSPLSVFAETTHDALKYTERGMEPLDVTSQLVTNKLHPDVRAMRDLFGGKDFYGRPLHGWERVEQAASDIAPVPLFARTGGYKGGAERQILSTLGIKATPAPSSSGDVYQLAADFKRKSGIKSQDSFPESDYAKLRKALANNDIDQAQKEYDQLKTSKGSKKVADYFQDFTKRPFTGSHATEKKFRATLDRGQTDLYTSALREREEIVKRYRALRR